MLTNITSIDVLGKLAKKKTIATITKKIAATDLEEAKAHGWKHDKTHKNGTLQVAKLKPYSIAIADRVWSLFYAMKFLFMNGEGVAQLIPERNTPFQRKLDIDVVGIDKEVGVAVFLKTSPSVREADEDFHQEIKLYADARSEFSHVVNSMYNSGKRKSGIKPAIVVFTCNIIIKENDKKSARSNGITIFDENDLIYYEELVKHLDSAAKYQFLADVLDDAEIPGLTIEVPAIQLKVGKIVYYSFAINPEYLLKISYIAHRTRGQKADEQAYQRMVEKKRLKDMQEYISEPAIFPTNIVMSLKKKPRFEPISATLQVAQGRCGYLGKLILKSSYKSAWIIDGQHRLYSYSGHPDATTSLLSVIAFEELSPKLQAEYFVDINSKQKRVEPALLNELFGEVHKDSPDPADRVKSLITQAIFLLDQNQDSPFYHRILGSEEKKTVKRCIKLSSIFGDLSDSLLTHHEHGILCVKGNDDATKERIVFVASQWFSAITKDASDWWDAGSARGTGGLAMNDCVSACFIVLRNVLQYLMSRQVPLVSLTNDALREKIVPYALIVSAYLGSLTTEERQVFRVYGRGLQGQTQRARTMLLTIQKELPDFASPTLKEHFRGMENEKAEALLEDMKALLLHLIMNILQDEFGDEESWWNEGVPDEVKQRISSRYNDQQDTALSRENYLDFQDYLLIISTQWDLFKNSLGYSDTSRYSPSYLAWLRKIHTFQENVHNKKKVTPTQLDELIKRKEWLSDLLSQENKV